MREIKFRGITHEFSSPGWVYGDLICNSTDEPRIMDDYYDCYEPTTYPVDSATIGQYTGLKDSTGKEIYEGDIVKLSPQFSVKQGLKREFRFPAVVRWDERLARFSLRSMEIIDSLCDSEYITVIGNVHDNPELLEAQA